MRVVSLAPILLLASAYAQISTVVNDDGRSVVVSVGGGRTSSIYSIGPDPTDEVKEPPEKTTETRAARPTDADMSIERPTRTVHADPHPNPPSGTVTVVPASGTILGGEAFSSYVASGDAKKSDAGESAAPGGKSGAMRTDITLSAVVAAAAAAGAAFLL